MPQVAVVGAGVIGLSTALHLLERFPGELDITIVSDKFSPNITSNRAGAIILFPIATVVSERHASFTEETKKWCLASLQRFNSIYRSKENAKAEICLNHGYAYSNSPLPDPWYKDEVFGFRHVKLDSVEASVMHIPPDCVDVWTFGTYLVEPTTYLTWLMDKVREGGAKVVQRKIGNLEELSSYDIVINCTGLGSHDLVDDKMLKPVKGQAILVDAPWVNQWIFPLHPDPKESCFGYIVPRSRGILLGGTAGVGDWNDTPDPETTMAILKKCQDLVPSLCSAKSIGSWAGLRPYRDPVRLDSCKGPGNGLLIHCYGHGGQGFILSWGCAIDIGDIVEKNLHNLVQN